MILASGVDLTRGVSARSLARRGQLALQDSIIGFVRPATDSCSPLFGGRRLTTVSTDIANEPGCRLRVFLADSCVSGRAVGFRYNYALIDLTLNKRLGIP